MFNRKGNMEHKIGILSKAISEENIWIKYGGMQLSHLTSCLVLVIA